MHAGIPGTASAVSVAHDAPPYSRWADVTFVCAQLVECALPFPAHALVVFWYSSFALCQIDIKNGGSF